MHSFGCMGDADQPSLTGARQRFRRCRLMVGRTVVPEDGCLWPPYGVLVVQMVAVLLVVLQLSCAPTSEFTAFHDLSRYPAPLESLVVREPFRASGKVVAMKGDIRYLARWAFVAREGQMRVQVFSMDGTFLADMCVREDSVFVLLPQEMEYHRGAADRLPLGTLLGLDIPWQQSIGAIDVLLWPSHNAGGAIAGQLNGKSGWLLEPIDVFVHIDPERLAPQYLRAGEGRDALVVEVDSFFGLPRYFVPERLSFEWAGHDERMWLEITSQTAGDVEEQAFLVPCPEHVIPYSW